MLLKKGKKRGVWLISYFDNNFNIYVYIAVVIKEFKILKKCYKSRATSILIKIINNIIARFLYLAC